MNIRELANRLRKAANVLDGLLDADLSEKRSDREDSARRNILKTKKKKKKKIAWQHRPGNAAKALAWKRKMKKVNRARREKA